MTVQAHDSRQLNGSKVIFNDGVKKLYDAQVEYIDLVKCVLDTHFTPSENFKLKFKFKTSKYSLDWSAIVRTGQNADPALSHSGWLSTCHILLFGTTDYISFNTLVDTEVVWTINRFLANSTSKSLSHGTWNPSGSVKFGSFSTPNVERLYLFLAYDNDQLIRNFIPVRIGDVGYFYDLVSNELFANELQTGLFEIGPDIM